MVLYLSSASYLPFSELNYGSPSLRKMELMLQKKMRSTVQTLSSEAPGEVDSYRGWEHHEISRSLHTRASSISISY